MKHFNYKRYLVVLCLGLSPLLAGGFQVNLQNTKRIGMGNVGIGYAPHSSSVFYNPGAMGALEKTQISAGASLILNKTAYAPFNDPEQGIYNDIEYSKTKLGSPFFLYATHRLKHQGEPTKLVLGLGVFTPFGSGIEWGNTWTGKSQLIGANIQTFYIQPTLAYNLWEGLSIGAGMDLIISSMYLEKSLPIGLTKDPSIAFSGRGELALSFNLGLFWQINKMISLGLNYRNGAQVALINGQIDYKNVITGSSAIDAALPKDNHFSAELPLPGVLGYGMGFTFKHFAIAFDVNYILWNTYKELKFSYEKPIKGDKEVSYARNYRNSWIFNLGAEYFVTSAITVRAGAYYDISPVRDNYMTPETPDANAVGYTAGMSYKVWRGLQIDAALLYIDKMERTNNPAATMKETNGLPGHFKTHALVPSLAISYQF